MTTPPPARVAGLTTPEVAPLERVAIRTRESGVTLSAWRLGASGTEGTGGILLVEAGPGNLYRGEGHFLGWTQEALGAAWTALLPPASTDTFETQQLG